MKSDVETCPKCQKPKKTDKSGSITQWVSLCNCDLIDPRVHPAEDIEICVNCGRRIETGRAGSITQFIFRYDICDCDVPVAFKRGQLPPRNDAVDGDSVASFEEIEPDENIELVAEDFPLERFKPISVIGKGAGGAVYLCKDSLLQKLVAIKTLNIMTTEQLISFQEEAKATSKLRHEHIVDVLDFGVTVSGTPYMVLEYVEATTLEDHLLQSGPLQWRDAVVVFSLICEALAYVHEQGIYHRDLKPSNILLSWSDGGIIDVRLIDFGIALMRQNETKEEQGRTLVGTPYYMPPDQALGYEYDERSEIYSLGAVIFEALSGRPPFSGDTPLETLSKHASETPPELCRVVADEELPSWLSDVVAVCLSKKPEDRYQSMIQLRRAIEQVLDASDLQSEPGGSNRRQGLLDSFLSTDNIIFLMAICLAVCGIAAIMFLIYRADFLKPVDPAVVRKELPAFSTHLKNGNKWYVWHGDVTSEKLLKLAACRDLERIDLRQAKIEDQSMDLLSEALRNRSPPVISVDLRGTKVTDIGLRTLASVDSIKVLLLDKCPELTDESAREISRFGNLVMLSLEMTAVGDGFIKRLTLLDQLYLLHVRECPRVTDRSIDAILAMPRLMSLRIGGTKISKASATKVLRDSSIVFLGISRLGLSERDIPSDINPNLSLLALINSPVSDRLLDKIRPLKNMWYLDLRGQNLVSMKGYQRMLMELPNLRILRRDSKNETVNMKDTEWYLEPELYEKRLWESENFLDQLLHWQMMHESL